MFLNLHKIINDTKLICAMKKIYFYTMLMLASMTVMLSSCDGWDSPYYVDDIVGSWVSYYGHDGYVEYDIMGYDAVRYDFYRDYTGRYTYYSYYGLDYVDFDWYTSGDRLIIHYYDGDSDYLFYGYDRNGDLLMSTDSRFYNFTAYRPAGMYYEPAKEMPSLESGVKLDKSVKEADKAAKVEKMEKNTVKAGSRAVKARAELTE